ncbi:MAG: arsenosugar biosynthesis radical SAM protein ArsS [Calditrichia bacterium]|nr:arsenosugar biosynthesis radical SAM protein ArsS [Calditrichia bacterium]
MSALSFITFQLNIGKRCNQACRHCHVGASPIRTEMMSRQTMDRCLEIIAKTESIEIVDITGGAPEMNEHFTYLVNECKKLGKHVIDRCNLTILEEPGYEHLYDFLSDNNVEIIASLPYFRKSHTDMQRGRGVFEKSITSLTKLNALGFGNGKVLNLVYNPAGAFLSAGQPALEREFKENLSRQYNISFNNLYCINNMPLDRFLRSLIRAEKLDEYMELLKNYFNPATLGGLMCRHQISVSYNGYVYDCDFNQILDLRAKPVSHINDFDYEVFISRKIRTANHCFGCTAGAGSSCIGEIA